MPPVDTRVPLYIGVAAPEIAIVLNDGNVNLYYQVEQSGGSTISANVNDGTLVPNSILTAVAPTYLLAADGGAQATIQFPETASSYAPGLTLADGTLVPANLVAQLTGNPADDVSAISAGTNQTLAVDLLTAAALGNVTGNVQVSLGGGDAQYTGIVLTGNATFSIVNAIAGSVLALDITAAGHTITHPTGTLWPNNTAPTPSGATDSYVYRVAAVSNGVPTKLYGAFLQGYTS